MTATKRAHKTVGSNDATNTLASPVWLKPRTQASSPSPFFPNAAVPMLLVSAILATKGGIMRLPDALVEARSPSCDSTTNSGTIGDAWTSVVRDIAAHTVDVVASELHTATDASTANRYLDVECFTV